MSISSIFDELDIIQEEVKAASTAISSNSSIKVTNQVYRSAASTLLEEKTNAKKKAEARVTYVPTSSFASSSSLEQIANSNVAPPTYWKSNSSSFDKKKVKAIKATSSLTKKQRMKQDRGEMYADKQKTKHAKRSHKGKK
jgi:hypothetical protein